MASRKKTTKETKVDTPPFHERFEIEVGIDDAKRRFMKRVTNYIFVNYFENQHDYTTRIPVLFAVANALGEKYESMLRFDGYIKGDFYRCLHALEVAYAILNKSRKSQLNYLIRLVLDESEIDLGVRWEPPVFIRAGARLLDLHLVNEPLRWLSSKKYQTVYAPFEKGLSHFLEAEKKPYLLSDVVTDMYESLEALSKIVTGRQNKDLSGNAEIFIKTVRASEHYRQILKDYISYANQFRHAAKQEGVKPILSMAEVESFIYLTGLFIRLAIHTEDK
jgi:hypothetical protein